MIKVNLDGVTPFQLLAVIRQFVDGPDAVTDVWNKYIVRVVDNGKKIPIALVWERGGEVERDDNGDMFCTSDYISFEPLRDDTPYIPHDWVIKVSLDTLDGIWERLWDDVLAGRS